MRAAVASLAVALLLAGCVDLPVHLVVRNESGSGASGTIVAKANGIPEEPGAGGDELRRWTFQVAAGEEARLGRLPAQEEGYLQLVATLDDGRTAEAAVLPASHAAPAYVIIRDDAVEIPTQSVR